MPGDDVDVLVVGAGIVGLAHAVAATRRGMTVHVIERDERAIGASVRNFGHVCTTAQSGTALAYALAARPQWLELGASAGFAVHEVGTVVVAREADEMGVLEEFAAARDGAAVLLDRRAVAERTGIDHGGIVGGAWLPQDLRVDQHRAVAALARWLEVQPAVSFEWCTSLCSVEPGLAATNRGARRAERVVVCVNHDVDRLFPAVAESTGLRRCRLRMLRVASPNGRPIDSAVLTGTSLLRYGAFAEQPSAGRIRDRLVATGSPLLSESVNLMFTQLPNGELTIGDTHHDAVTHEPFVDESLDRLLLGEVAALLGVADLDVIARWSGVYASAPGDFLVESPLPGVDVVSVTSGIGMTTAFGLAAHVVDSW